MSFLSMLLLRKDLLALPRRPWFRVKRLIAVVFAACIVCFGLLIGIVMQSTTFGLTLFMTLSMSALIVVCVLSVFITGLGVVRDRIEKRMDLLLITDMSLLQQVIGRIAAGSLAGMSTLLSVFPMLALCAVLGGVSGAQIASAFVLLIGCSFLSGSIGLFVGSVVRTETAAVIAGGGSVAAVLTIFPILVSGLFPAGHPLVYAASPFESLQALCEGRVLWSGAWNFLFNVPVGMVFLVLAARFMASRTIDDRGAVRRTFRLTNRARALPAAGNPVLWKDLHTAYGGTTHAVLSALLLACGITVVTAAIAILAGANDPAEAGLVGLTAASVASVGVFSLVCLLRSARAFNSETRGHTMDLLLLSNLTDGEIVKGKIWAILRSTFPWLFCAVLTGLLPMIAWGGPEGVLVPICLTASWTTEVLAFSCMALYLSLSFGTPAVIGICGGMFMVWNVLVKSCFPIPVALLGLMFAGAMGSSVLGFMMFPFLVGGSAMMADAAWASFFLYMLNKNMRVKAMRAL